MNRIAHYLNANLLGEVTYRDDILKHFSQDRGIFSVKPNLVALPKNSSDIRKIVSLAHQLAKKTKPVAVGIRGHGSDFTGGCLTDGILINTSRHFNQILDFDPDQALIHVQAGTGLKDMALIARDHGLDVSLATINQAMTIGGVIGNNPVYPLATKTDNILNIIDQLEVILDDGSTLQAKALTKRELNQKIGLSTREGEIYRKIDALIEDNQALLADLAKTHTDNSGYSGISRVKTNNSFNLIPLFLGSQGTLGLISEAIIKLKDRVSHSASLLLSFHNLNDTLTAASDLAKLDVIILDIYDQVIFDNLKNQGKELPELKTVDKKLGQKASYHLILRLETRNNFSLKNQLKKVTNIAKRNNAVLSQNNPDLLNIRELVAFGSFDNSTETAVDLACGANIPLNQWTSFISAIAKLGLSLDMQLPIYGSVLSGVLNLFTRLNLQNVADKQKSLKILNYYLLLSAELGGKPCLSGAEGRLKGLIISKHTPPELINLYNQIKDIFDPYRILAPHNKQPAELRKIASKITSQPKNDYYIK